MVPPPTAPDFIRTRHLALKAVQMTGQRFVVAIDEEHWCISYRGLWYGGYADKGTALGVAVQLASTVPDLASEVVLQEADGTEVVFWRSE
jgi:hypothetical protein